VSDLHAMIRRRKRWDLAFNVLGAAVVVLSLAFLGMLLADLIRDGLPRLGRDFLTEFPSRKPEKAGIKSAIIGTSLVMLVTTCTAIPLGIAAGLYLEEYARKNWVTTIIEINIANLAGVPSIIWGLMSLGLLVYQLHLGRSILTAGLTLGLLVLPIVIVATREALRSIPQGIREGSYACGATRWQTMRHHVLPYSLSGIFTGAIIALSRAIGETAPLITIGALTYIAFLPPAPFSEEAAKMAAAKAPVADAGWMTEAFWPVRELGIKAFGWLGSEFTVLPIQAFNWVSRPDPRFQVNAAAAGVILLAMTLSMNAVAIMLRYRLRKRYTW